MAKLINGNGNPAVYAAEDADWFAAIMGNQTSITGIGEQFRADQADANTIEVFDGVIITKEGRRIQLDANAVDLFEIPTGVPGTTSYYIIGYHLYNDENSNQFCEAFTQKMDTASETIPEYTFRGGADEVFVSLYRITQDGLTITDIDLLLPSIGNVGQLNNDLSVFSFKVNNGVPQFSIDGGTTWNNLGGGSMKCVKSGTFTSTTTIDLSDYNFTSGNDYIVNINTNAAYRSSQYAGVGAGGPYNNSYGFGGGAYVSARSATSVTITVNEVTKGSYEIIKL